VLRSLSPHRAIVSIAFVAALVLVRPVVARQRRRSAERRGLVGSTRLRIACAAVGVLAAALAIVAGGDPLISGVVASAAVAAYLAGMPGLAAASIIAGAIANAVFLGGIDPAADEVLVGAGLVAAGLACQALERRER
jgi:hypothetical protein